VERTLSARHTPLVKFVLPPLWLAIVGYATWQLSSNPDALSFDPRGAAAPVVRGVLLALILASLVVLAAFVVPLKHVRLGPNGLRVSSYGREVAIPFSAIGSVRQGWLPTFRLITIDLRSDAARARRVIFMPAGPCRWAIWRADYWREDEIVQELRRRSAVENPRGGAMLDPPPDRPRRGGA